MKIWKTLLLAGALAIGSFTMTGAENLVKAYNFYDMEWDKTFTTYVNLDTSWVDKNKIFIWTKAIDINGNPAKTYYCISLPKKRVDTIIYYCYVPDYNGYRETNHADYVKHDIHPASVFERLANIVLKANGKPPLLGKEVHDWQWTYSDEKYNYMICTDYYQYNPKKQIGTFYFSKEVPNPDNPDYVMALTFDFKNKQVIRLDDLDIKGKSDIYLRNMKDRVESYYNSAYALIKDIKTK